ncbi:FAD dependent oxidoreductase [Alcanivorax hongdengensis A-11-3]|uniref:FAD dependent oxidoreductase n=1 Tax=Alcanivorax hongdengensis A-11-3 TaxID=1177179 RepID=L0WCS7_9GAMM|nr:FAD-dependent oxidoreductase [Alcanivorax hongdengensis]EKF74543.1 FAD dependent oxidoreductase [Alcanivorax hongdengensis A-11-3]
MKNRQHLAIVGAGVAGLALAILAARQGWRVCLYERHERITTLGAGVTLWPNALFVLEQMGLAGEVSAVGGAPRFVRQWDHRGVSQGERDIQALNVLSGFATVTVLRRDLMAILYRAARAQGVEMHFGRAMTAADIVMLSREAELVVGADGRMQSVVREVLFADTVRPRYQGFVNIVGISEPGPGVLDNAIQDFRGQGERFGVVPVKPGVCYWAAGWRASLDRARPVTRWYEEMHGRFQHWPEPVKTALACHEKGSRHRIFVHDMDPLPYWHRGNVLLIGDAAHAPLPTSGQGACQALEDAWHLGRLLDESGDLPAMLATFYQRRIDKCCAAQHAGRQLAEQLFAETPVPLSAAPVGSMAQLSAFWMRGLGPL